MCDVTSDDNLGLNLYIVPTTCHTVIISENQGLVRWEFLYDFSWKSIREFLVDFQTWDYRVSTGSYIPSL